jgi:hypothetical protein
VAHDRLEAITSFSFRRYLCNHLPVETRLKEIVFVAWGWNLALIFFADQPAPNVHLRHGIPQTLNIQGLARTYGKKVEDLPSITARSPKSRRCRFLWKPAYHSVKLGQRLVSSA